MAQAAGPARDELTPLGRLLEDARESLRISKREAARRADISEGRWRQITIGHQKAGDVTIPVNPRRNTVTAMARAVGVDPAKAQLAAGMEPDSPEEPKTGDQPPLDPDLRRYLAVLADPDVDQRQKELMREQMRLWVEQIEAQKGAASEPRQGRRAS